MTKKNRTILFFSCLGLFLLSAPLIVFYSQGYRFDYENKKISQTGGLFLKIKPKNAEIYLNGKLKDKTDFFFGSALLSNLLPKKYQIQIKKEGYLPWQKNLEIKEKEVTEIKNIVLIPEESNFDPLERGINDFYFSPDEKKIVLKEIKENSWALKIYDLTSNVKSHLIEGKDLSKKGAELLNLNFSPDSKELSLEAGIEEKIENFNLKIDEVPPILTKEEKAITPPKEVIVYQVVGKDIYYLDNLGFLNKGESWEQKIRINETPFPVLAETKYQLNIFHEDIFLQEGEILYLFNPSSKSFEKIADKVNSLKISPDKKKIAYFNDHEIWVLFLKEELEQPQKKKGEKIFIARFSEKIGEVFWYTSHYLLFNAGDKIKIAEIDDRDRINIVDLVPAKNFVEIFGEFKNPKIYWNQTDKKLYLLSQGNLYRSEKLIR